MKIVANRLSIAALLMAPLLVVAGPVSAATIYDNGVADGGSAFASDVAFSTDGNQVADDFSLQSGAATITDVHWTGVYSPNLAAPGDDDFSISIFEDNGVGRPQGDSLVDAVLGTVTRTPTTDILMLSAYTYSVDIDPIPLTAGVTYWLSILNNSTTNNPNFDWYWAASNSSAGSAAQRVLSSPLGDWTGVSREFAFRLTNDNLPVGGVPVPGSLLLMIPGLLLLRRFTRA